MDDLVGQDIGTYHITSLLALGDVAHIYLAQNKQTRKRVAFKVVVPPSIKPEISLEDEKVEPANIEMEAEAESVSKSEEEPAEKQPGQEEAAKEDAIDELSQEHSSSSEQPSYTPEPLSFEYMTQHVINEAHFLTHFNHLNIIRILDFNAEDDVAYIAQEYIRDSDLRQRHPRGGQLSPALVLSYVKQVASTLQYLHSLKIVHRHLKPEHLLVAPANRIVLCGFGQVLSPWTLPEDTTYPFLGTPTYTAPEQFEGLSLPASDQYTLAIMIYEWLCGKPPFAGSTNELQRQHLDTSPPLLTDIRPGLPPAIEQVVLLALAKDPKQRFANISAFARAFEQACILTQTGK